MLSVRTVSAKVVASGINQDGVEVMIFGRTMLIYIGLTIELAITNDPDYHFDAEDSVEQRSRVARASGQPRCQKLAG